MAARERWVVLERTAEGRRAVVAVNAGEEPVSIDLAVVGAGMRPLELPGLASGPAGESLTLPPLSGAVFVDD